MDPLRCLLLLCFSPPWGCQTNKVEQPCTQNDQANVVGSKPSSSKYTENKSSQIVHIMAADGDSSELQT